MGEICGKKYMIQVPEHVANQEDIDESKLPNFWTIMETLVGCAGFVVALIISLFA